MGGTKVKEVEDTASEETKDAVKHKEKEKKTESSEPKTKKILTVRKRPRHGKKYRALEGKVETSKLYALDEASGLVKELSTSSFDGSVEIHVRLGVDTSKSDQSVRGTVSLPKGTGKTKRVGVITGPDKLKEAADADVKGGEELIAEIEKGKFNFDVLIATPEMMPKLAKVAKILGPKGLMPNPKTGTVTEKVAQAVSEFKGGKQEFKMDSLGIVHGVIGKISMSKEDILENAKAYLTALQKAKPDAVKGALIKTVTISPTMGRSVKVDIKSI